MVRSSRITFSASAARAAVNLDDDDEEPGEEIESAPPLRVGEEREITTSGLRKKLLKPGHGWETPVSGDQVTVHYVGSLLDGTKFISTWDKGEPLTFTLGSGEEVIGLDQGIITMKKGEVALFTLPSSLGYGSVGAEGVPPYTDLKFEVELLSWLTVVDICKDGGIVKKILSGGGDKQAGDLDEVKVKYQVKLLDGPVVAETPEEGLEIYVNAAGHLCPALPKVLKTMKVGEKAVVTTQPQYIELLKHLYTTTGQFFADAFGEEGKDACEGYPPIPSNAMLSIDVELVSLKHVVDVTGDMKVLKKIMREGDGTRTPHDGETVQIRYSAMLEDGSLFEKLGFDEGPFEFVIDEEQVVSGLDCAVATMLKGELSQVTVKPEYGFGNGVVIQDSATIPACSTLIYEVELLDFKQEKEAWEMNTSEKLQAAEKTKIFGNELYKIGKFQRAAKKYDKAVNYVNDNEPFEDGEERLATTLRVSCWLNHAACCLKLKDFQETIRLCSKVLDVEFCNVKALYRRAQANIEFSDLDLAKMDILKALEVDPQNREVKSLHMTLKQLQAESNKRDTKLYANIFGQRVSSDTGVVTKRAKVERCGSDRRDGFEVQAMTSEHQMEHEVEKVEEKVRDAKADSGEIEVPLATGTR